MIARVAELTTPYAVHGCSYQKCPLHTEDQNYQHQKHGLHNYFLILV